MMKKRILAYFMTMALCAGMLAGCGGKNGEHAAEKTQDISEGSGTTESAGTEGKINFDEEPYEVVIENLTLGQEMPDLVMVEEEIYKITLPEINCTVKLMNVHIGDHTTKLSLMAAGGEKVDIVTTGRTYALPNMVVDGLLLPLDGLLAERGQDILGKAGNLLEGSRVGDSVYAIPGSLYVFSSNGIIYNKEFAEQYQITIPEKPTIEDVERIAVQVKEADPNMYLMSKGTATEDLWFMLFYPEISVQGTSGMYGALKKDDDTGTLYNLFKSDEYREYLHRNRKWYENGWIPTDSMVSGVNVRDVFLTQQSFLEFGGVSPLQLGVLQPSYDFELGMTYVTDPEVSTGGIQENGWGISINCDRPDKAMDFLNLLYSNADLSNLLSNGVEGVHYEKVSDRIIQYPDGVDAGNVGYSCPFSLFGDMMQNYQWVPVTEEAFEECMERAEEAEISPTFGYSFDTTKVSTQISNVTNVLSEYLPGLLIGIYPDEEIDMQLDKMIEALDAAGIEEIIAENQRQLDEWKATAGE